MKLKLLETQKAVLDSICDIIIFGGSAGGGKTFAFFYDIIKNFYKLLSLPASERKYVHRSYIIRKTYKDAGENFKKFDRILSDMMNHNFKKFLDLKIIKISKNKSSHSIIIDTNKFIQEITFSNISHDFEDKYQGMDIDCFYVDEATQDFFTFGVFNYLRARNRNALNPLRKYITLSCNPRKDHFLRDFLDDYIDNSTGYIKDHMDRKIRYWFLHDETFYFGKTKKEVLKKIKDIKLENAKLSEDNISSLQFIRSKLSDNPHLYNDGQYDTKLLSQSRLLRLRWREGNWNITEETLRVFDVSNFSYFNSQDFEKLQSRNIKSFYDISFGRNPKQSGDSDYQCCVVICYDSIHKIYYVLDYMLNKLPFSRAIKEVAKLNKKNHVTVCMPELNLLRTETIKPLSEAHNEIDYPIRIYGYNSTKNKENRISTLEPVLYSNRIRFNENFLKRKDWKDAVLPMFRDFPFAKYDDFPDALEAGIEKFKNLDIMSEMNRY